MAIRPDVQIEKNEITLGVNSYIVEMKPNNAVVIRFKGKVYAVGKWQPIGGFVRWTGEKNASSNLSWLVADAVDEFVRQSSGWKPDQRGLTDVKEMFAILDRFHGSSIEKSFARCRYG